MTIDEAIAHSEEVANDMAKCCDECAAEHKQLAEWLQELKGLREQIKWIPVSERLPEVDGRYLTTCSKIGKWEVDWNIWYNEPKPSWLWEQGVTAWMPLPKPYVPDTNDGKMSESEE